MNLEPLRHSTAHLLATAILKLYPDTKLGIGPVVENGFYYDFDFSYPISESDLPKIEAEMTKIAQQNLPFKKSFKTITEAKKLVKYTNQKYKLELIEELAKQNKSLSFYTTGDFVDLCEGPHIANTSQLQHFKLLSIAGAYWRGSEKNPQLTRIYGTAWKDEKDLKDYLEKLEEAKKNDHRKIGKELELFTTSDEIGQGLILWLPKGTVIREELEKFAKITENRQGYLRISTPHIAKESLFYTSGHLPYFADDMYPPIKTDEGNYYLKPMNCPHTHIVYAAKKHSYRELPVKYAEFGTVYRHEKSGELTGLLRVRGMTQNDAHIYCAEEQVVDELVKVMKLHSYYYKIFGIDNYYVELALPDFKTKKGKYFDNPAGWNNAIKILRLAAKKSGIEYLEKTGEAAFYGPKFDFNIKSVLGREFGLATNQLDFGSGAKFGLTYVDKTGDEKTIPYIIHRAPLGSDERFVGFLTELYGGAFPTWLAPVQAVVIPISDKNLKYAQTVFEKLAEAGIRTEINEHSETMQSKIRDATLQKVPYMVICGAKEEANKKIAVRTREGKDLGSLSLDKFLEMLRRKIENREN